MASFNPSFVAREWCATISEGESDLGGEGGREGSADAKVHGLASCRDGYFRRHRTRQDRTFTPQRIQSQNAQLERTATTTSRRPTTTTTRWVWISTGTTVRTP